MSYKFSRYLTINVFTAIYTQWISRCFATARERIPGSMDNSVTGVSECNQQRGNMTSICISITFNNSK
ncbi:hypothetical protein [Photorhabdus laumondii]|uniref:hypothetical protein n=1 Tax=Photorhabdus laumondii TaxID=2218628 RepID=UPI0033163B1C